MQSAPKTCLSRRAVLSLIAGAAMSAVLPVTLAHAMTPQEKHVAAVANNVIALANSGHRGVTLRNQVATLLVRYSDVNGIAQFALGKYRRQLPSAMRKTYNHAVLYYLAALFTRYADDFVGSGVQIRSSRESGKFILVDSSLNLSRGGNTKLRWRLRAKGNYRKIADINFRGIWLSLRLREEIGSVLARHDGDFNALIGHLHANS